MVFRKFREADLDQLVALTKENMSPIIKEAWDQDWDEGYGTMFRSDLGSNGELMVCIEDERIAGYFWFSEQDQQGALFIHSMQVRKGSQVQGIGRKMLEWMESHAVERKLNALVLVVQPNNERAVRFYESFGFTGLGTDEAGITMRKKPGT